MLPTSTQTLPRPTKDTKSMESKDGLEMEIKIYLLLGQRIPKIKRSKPIFLRQRT